MIQGTLDKHIFNYTVGGSDTNPVGVKRKVDADDDDQMLEERTLKRTKTSLIQKPENMGPKSSIQDDPEDFHTEIRARNRRTPEGIPRKSLL